MYAILILVIVILIIVRHYKKTYSYWSSKNVKCDIPLPLFGNNLKVIIGIQTISEFCNNLYNKYSNEKIIGCYRGTEPMLMVCDLDLLKHVFTTDFIHFHKRGLGSKTDSEPLLRNAFFVDGDRWRVLRRIVTPAFTGSKLRSMFSCLEPNIVKLQILIREYASRGEIIDAYDLMARFIIESIGINSFGVELNTIHKKYSTILELGKGFFRKSACQKVLYLLKELFPRKYTKFITIPEHDLRNFFTAIVSTARDLNKSYKNAHFFDMLMEIKQKGKLHGLSLDQVDENGKLKMVEFQFDDNDVAAQLFLQFAGGFETSSCAASFALHELAHHPKLQEDVQENIDVILSKYDNKICYDAISEMTLLVNVVKESLRLFPPAGTTTRICTKDYKLPGTDIVIPKGMRILIPIHAIHMDPRYYDNPDRFEPERFSAENVRQRHNYTYLPFGEGPRKCIGAQQALLLLMTGLVTILQKYTVEPASPRKYVTDKSAHLVQIIKGGLPIKLKPRMILNEENSQNEKIRNLLLQAL